jgi:hypothetical protein
MLHIKREPTGSGKSTKIRQRAVEVAARLAAGEVVVVGVPRHHLGEEQLAALRDKFPDSKPAAIWRGRGAADPDHPGEQMCLRYEEVQKVQKLKLDVDKSLCQQDTLRCQFFDRCGYQRQKRPAAIWFTAHETLVHEKPKVIGKVKELLIDEDPVDALLWFDKIALDDFAQVSHARNRDDPNLGQRLTGARRRLVDFIEDLPDGPIPKSDLHHFAGGWAERQAKGEWYEKVEPDIDPGMSRRQVEDAVANATNNTLMDKRIKLWKAVADAVRDDAPELCGRLKLKTVNGRRFVMMSGIQQINSEFGEPAFLTDASADPGILRHIWPQLDPGKAYWPFMDHARFRQLVDRSFGKMSIAPADQDDEVDDDDGEDRGSDEAQPQQHDRKRTVLRMWSALLVDAGRRYGGKPVVTVTYKATENYIKQNLYVPAWMTLAHFGDISGLDRWREVRAIYVVGRTLPPAESVTRMAEALGGEGIRERNYVEAEVPIPIARDADGYNTVLVKQWHHPHPLAERIRRQICEGGLMQVIGRVRAMWRTATNPVDVNIWTDVPLYDSFGANEASYNINYPVEPILWGDINTGPSGLMIGSGGVWLKNSKDAELAYPSVSDADWLREQRSVGFSIRRLLYRETHTPRPTKPVLQPLSHAEGTLKARYQRKGAGHRPAVAVFLPGFTREQARDWLQARLGPLVLFEA